MRDKNSDKLTLRKHESADGTDIWYEISEYILTKLIKMDVCALNGSETSLCDLCCNNRVCNIDTCPSFTCGVGAVDDSGREYPDFAWDCRDFVYGTCPVLENTPCNGCIENNDRGFELDTNALKSLSGITNE